jgi:ATP-dependent DNA ligase
MLARLVRQLPLDGFMYEPKWDGFRALAFRDGASVDLRSRNQRPLARYFPEVVAAVREVAVDRFVLDGEILVVRGDGRFDFTALMGRLHPAASRVERLRSETPASFVAFDLLAVGDEDLRACRFDERRARLEQLLRPATSIAGPQPSPGGPPRVALTPLTEDPDVAARWLEGFNGGGVDGVVAKHRSLPYTSDRRTMLKAKRQRTAECVVAGFRRLWNRAALSSLLLGLHDDHGVLRHVGVVSSFSEQARRAVLEHVTPLVTAIAGHPWERGFGLARSPVGRLAGAAGRWVPGEMEMDWVPLRPELVCEVAYDTVDDHRFRFPARFLRWRPDRDPGSCSLEQLDQASPEIAELLRPG